jgi:tol-pal system protein YbgF
MRVERAPDGSRGGSRTLRLSAVASAALLGACWYPKERGQTLEQRVERIEGESPAGGKPDAELASVRDQLRRVDATLAEVKTRLQQLDEATRSRPQPSAREGELAEGLKRVGAALEGYAQRLAAVERTLAEPRRSGCEASAEPRRPAARAPAAERPPAPEPPAARETPGSSGKTDYLALAREQERRGEKTVARELYEQYVAEFPADPASADAHFRLGELAFGDRRYRDAIVEFGKVARDFPRSDKAPDALLRTAASMLKLDLKDEAATVLSEVPQRYPASPAAARARKQLAELPRTSAAPGRRE